MKKHLLNIGLPLAFALAAASSAVLAQGVGKADVPPPPPPARQLVEVLDNEAISTTKKPEPANKTTEKKNALGQVTEVEVTSGGSHYVLRPNPEHGNTPRGTPEGDANRAAQWKLLEFGGKKESKEKEVEPLPVLPPAPVNPVSASAVK